MPVEKPTTHISVKRKKYKGNLLSSIGGNVRIDYITVNNSDVTVII